MRTDFGGRLVSMSDTASPAKAGSVRLGQGEIRYQEAGEGVVFVHGILANGVLWRDVVLRLSGRFRCVVPELPLGGHAVPLRPEADLGPKGVARIVADFLEALDLRDVTLVGNHRDRNASRLV